MAECKKCGKPISTYSIWTTGIGSPRLCRECSAASDKPKPSRTAWCKQCHKEVSPEAITCPQCGQPDPATNEMPTEAKLEAISGLGRLLLAFGLIALLIFGWFVCQGAK